MSLPKTLPVLTSIAVILLVAVLRERSRAVAALLAATAAHDNLAVSDQTLQQTILGIPGITVDGKFDTARYKALLAAQGMTPSMYEGLLERTKRQ